MHNGSRHATPEAEFLDWTSAAAAAKMQKNRNNAAVLNDVCMGSARERGLGRALGRSQVRADCVGLAGRSRLLCKSAVCGLRGLQEPGWPATRIEQERGVFLPSIPIQYPRTLHLHFGLRFETA